MIKNWILAFRPKTLTASLAPIILAASYNYKLTDHYNFPLLFIIALCAILLQISTNLVNDYMDGIKGRDDTSRLGPQRVTSTGLISAAAVKKGFMISFSLAFLIGVYLISLGGMPIALIGLSSIFFAYIYTGGPYPLSTNGLGEVFSLLYFGMLPVWGTCYLLNPSFILEPAILGIAPGLAASILISINNLRDIEADSLVSKKTIAVKLGSSGARKFTLSLVSLAFLYPLVLAFLFKNNFIILACLPTLLFIKSWNRIRLGKIDAGLNLVLENTGKYLLLYCLTISLGLNL